MKKRNHRDPEQLNLDEGKSLEENYIRQVLEDHKKTHRRAATKSKQDCGSKRVKASMEDLYKRINERTPTDEELHEFVIYGFHANYCVQVNKNTVQGIDQLLQGVERTLRQMNEGYEQMQGRMESQMSTL